MSRLLAASLAASRRAPAPAAAQHPLLDAYIHHRRADRNADPPERIAWKNAEGLVPPP